jgi:hypothetical protein
MSQNGDERERHLTKLRAIFADFVRLVNAFSRGGRPRLLFGANAPRFDIFTPDALFWLAEVPPGEDPATVTESMRTPRLQLQGLPMSADPPSDSSPETTTPSAPPPSSSQPASTTTTSTLLMTSRASSARSGGRDAAPHPPSPATSCAAHPFLSLPSRLDELSKASQQPYVELQDFESREAPDQTLSGQGVLLTKASPTR